MHEQLLDQASRKILWNLSSGDIAVFYALLITSVLLFCCSSWAKVRLWLSGRDTAGRTGLFLGRAGRVFTSLFFQQKIRSKLLPGLSHFLIVSGFMVLLLATTVVLLAYDFDLPIFEGRYYLAISLSADIFGATMLLGLLIACYRRYVSRPDCQHQESGDAALLSALLLLIVQGFLLEALRIAATEDPWAKYSPVGYALSQGILIITKSPQLLTEGHYFLWWFHSLTVFGLIAVLPHSKLLHLISSAASLYFYQGERATGALPYPGDIEALISDPSSSQIEDLSLGVSSVKDLSWKQLLELDACTSCGRCQEECPAYLTGKPLSPKWVILDTKFHLRSLISQGNKRSPSRKLPFVEKIDRMLSRHLSFQIMPLSQRSKAKRASNPEVQNAALCYGRSAESTLCGEVMKADVFWACTTCGACVEHCPVGIEHVDYIVQVRRAKVLLEGEPPTEIRQYLRSLENRGNPFGPAQDRELWSAGLSVPILKPGDTVEVLYWVGCLAAYDKSKQKIARAMAKILNAANISWGILGNRENCCGDTARRLGEESLFQHLAKTNLEALNSINFKTLLTHCPHCFNTLKNEYSQIGTIGEGGKINYVHHSTYIKTLLDTGQVKLKNVPHENDSPEYSKTYTYHDPCYLGRYNGIYDEPRDLLNRMGIGKLVEIEKSSEHALCCGAGGGQYWFDVKIGSRINELRANQAKRTGAECVVTSCPFCLQMITDGLMHSGDDNSTQIKDISELIAEHLTTT